jgi:hypothetical protein
MCTRCDKISLCDPLHRLHANHSATRTETLYWMLDVSNSIFDKIFKNDSQK